MSLEMRVPSVGVSLMGVLLTSLKMRVPPIGVKFFY
jgi:hypothetical protein